jgi:putative ABC transport system substrate-binding protein
MDAVDGFRNQLEGNFDVVYLEDQKLRTDDPQDLWVAVGPQAMEELWKSPDLKRKFYMMVLHPKKVVDPDQSLCGIPLDLSFSFQMNLITRTFPQIRRVGILYDPRFNRRSIAEARKAASIYNLELMELQVSHRKEIPDVLKTAWDRIDLLWVIPDRTVISETIIRYLIKESLLHGSGLVGYNKFFLESGATMAFVIDYKELGRKAGQMAEVYVREDLCWSAQPPVRLKINGRAVKHLGWKISESLPYYVELE